MIPSSKKKRIVLVHPRGFNWFPGKTDITDIANRMVPQGLLSIAAYLEQEGHEVFVYDCLGPRAPVNLNDQVRAILAYRPQIVGFSATTSSFPDAADLAQDDQRTHSPYFNCLRRCPCLRARRPAACRLSCF